MRRAPSIDGVLSPVAAGVLAAVARLRRARPVHPHGVGFAGSLEVRAGPGLELVPALGPPRETRAVLRLSRSFGVPRPLMDILGLAVKLPDLHGRERDQDFLFVSALGGGIGAYVPVPAARYSWRTFSSLLPYRSGGRLIVPGAFGASRAAAGGEDELDGALVAARRGELRFVLTVAPALGRFVAVGELTAVRELPRAEVQALRFNPFNTADTLVPAAGPLNGMRRAAYPASQRARPDTDVR